MISTQKHWFMLGAAYLFFVIFGSLVPLNFHPLSLEKAWTAFTSIRFLNLGIESRADWVANILLFIPLAFVWLGAFWHGQGVFARSMISIGLLAACVILSVGIEFTQLFFPPRTVSQNDILAEVIGASLGISLWWLSGNRLMTWLAEWRSIHRPAELSDKVLWTYLALLFAYSLLPLDLSISPVEIYHKWKEGRVIIIPFGSYSDLSTNAIYELTTDVALWLPVAALIVISKRKTVIQAIFLTVVAAAFLETLQLFVYTRVTDSTDVITAVIGGTAGAFLGSLFCNKPRLRQARSETTVFSWQNWIGPGALIVWLFILGMIFWYPYDFILEPQTIIQRLKLFYRVPFDIYYYGSEYRAVTEVLHKFLFFIPVGAIFSVIGVSLSRQGLTLIGFKWLILTLCTGVALLVELGQVALPQKNPDSTDLVLETLGGWAGYWLMELVRRWRHADEY